MQLAHRAQNRPMILVKPNRDGSTSFLMQFVLSGLLSVIVAGLLWAVVDTLATWQSIINDVVLALAAVGFIVYWAVKPMRRSQCGQ